MVKRIIIIILSSIVGLFIIYHVLCIADFMDPSNPNRDLALAEYKAKFRQIKHLSGLPETDNVHIEIQGVINLNDYDKKDRDIAVYNAPGDIKIINNYLKHMNLAVADEHELASQSPDVFIKYYNNEGSELKTYIVYGQVFIKDLQAEQLYRIKNPNKGIIDGLEGLF